MNPHWPHNPGNDLVPWYIMIRRAVCLPWFYLFRCLTCLCVGLGWGYRDAKYWWEESW